MRTHFIYALGVWLATSHNGSVELLTALRTVHRGEIHAPNLSG